MQFQLLSGQLYYLGDDKILRLVFCPNDYHDIMSKAHVSSCGFFYKDGTMKRISGKGY